MQEITFAKGNEQHLKDCRAALCQSTLGERYFSSPGNAEIAILEAAGRAGALGDDMLSAIQYETISASLQAAH